MGEVIAGINDSSIKYTFTDPLISETEIMERLAFGSIDLTGCFDVVDDGVFRKIRQGLITELSPPPRPAKARTDST